MSDTPREGFLLNQLPTPYRVDSQIYRDPATGQEATVYPTADFLRAFEAVLLQGIPDDQDRNTPEPLGLERLIDKLSTYFVAGERRRPLDAKTPEEFLPWLASWLAFSMRADLPASARRDFVHNLTVLYRWRGTQENLKRVLGTSPGCRRPIRRSRCRVPTRCASR